LRIDELDAASGWLVPLRAVERQSRCIGLKKENEADQWMIRFTSPKNFIETFTRLLPQTVPYLYFSPA
jgi:hypothetical protein